MMHFLRALGYIGFLLAAANAVRSADPPETSSEHDVLDRFLGSWRTKYKLPKAELNPQEATGAADLTYSRILGGQFVQEQGEHSDKTTTLQLFTYDVPQKCYRSWRFTSLGQKLEATGKWDAEAKTLTWTSVDRTGRDFVTTTTHRFVGDDAFEWEVVVKENKSTVLLRMEGKAVRVKK